MCGRLDEAKGLIEEGVDLDSEDELGSTPLIFAAAYNKVDIVQLLLDNGANVNNKSNGSETAIHIATYQGNDEIVKLLIERGADLHVKDSGLTPLDIAKKKYRFTTIALIERAINSTKGKNK